MVKISRKILVLLTLVLFLAFVCTVVYAADAQKQPNQPSKEKVKGCPAGFTPDQLEKLKAIKMKFDDKREGLMIKVQIKKLELAELLRQDEPDQKKIEAKLDEINAIEGQLHKTMIAEYFEIRKVLTPQQRRFFVRKIIREILGGGIGVSPGKQPGQPKRQPKNK